MNDWTGGDTTVSQKGRSKDVFRETVYWLGDRNLEGVRVSPRDIYKQLTNSVYGNSIKIKDQRAKPLLRTEKDKNSTRKEI